jgi:hypothetical protein
MLFDTTRHAFVFVPWCLRRGVGTALPARRGRSAILQRNYREPALMADLFRNMAAML